MWEHPKEIYQTAYKQGYAVGTFNISNLECLKGIIQAAEELRSPVMIATSKGEGDFIDPDVAVTMVKAVAQKASVPVGLHLDHGKSLDEIKSAVEAGYLSVHIDASDKTYDDNIQTTQAVMDFVREKGINVEGEIGHVGGSSQMNSDSIDDMISKEGLTNPEEAWHYAHDTGIDQLAIAVGNIHGIYKGEPHIDMEILEQISSKVQIPLVLHGGSGIPEDQVKRAISLGIAKVNINTEVRLAYCTCLRQILSNDPDLVVPYKIFPPVIEAVREIVKTKISIFQSAGKA